MSHTPHQGTLVCTHQRGAGTVVCVHCRKEARLAANERRRKLLLRGTAGAIVVATGLAVSAFGATVIRERNAHRPTEANASQATPAPAASIVQPVASVSTPTDSDVAKSPQASAAAGPVAAAPAKPSAPLTPILPIGASTIQGGIAAQRTDSAIVLSFDFAGARTRIPEKFERLVRTTLPAIYGSPVDSVLARVPAGSFARQGNLVSELPTRGVRLPIDSAWELRVYPETRPGQDGPLVIRYRATTVAR